MNSWKLVRIRLTYSRSGKTQSRASLVNKLMISPPWSGHQNILWEHQEQKAALVNKITNFWQFPPNLSRGTIASTTGAAGICEQTKAFFSCSWASWSWRFWTHFVIAVLNIPGGFHLRHWSHTCKEKSAQIVRTVRQPTMAWAGADFQNYQAAGIIPEKVVMLNRLEWLLSLEAYIPALGHLLDSCLWIGWTHRTHRE